jgi:uncharacterized protein YlxW (UPF0749 family)
MPHLGCSFLRKLPVHSSIPANPASQVESIKASTLHRQQQVDSEAVQLQHQQAELTQQMLEFQTRVARAEASVQEREAALGDLQVMHCAGSKGGK